MLQGRNEAVLQSWPQQLQVFPKPSQTKRRCCRMHRQIKTLQLTNHSTLQFRMTAEPSTNQKKHRVQTMAGNDQWGLRGIQIRTILHQWWPALTSLNHHLQCRQRQKRNFLWLIAASTIHADDEGDPEQQSAIHHRFLKTCCLYASRNEEWDRFVTTMNASNIYLFTCSVHVSYITVIIRFFITMLCYLSIVTKLKTPRSLSWSGEVSCVSDITLLAWPCNAYASRRFSMNGNVRATSLNYSQRLDIDIVFGIRYKCEFGE